MVVGEIANFRNFKRDKPTVNKVPEAIATTRPLGCRYAVSFEVTNNKNVIVDSMIKLGAMVSDDKADVNDLHIKATVDILTDKVQSEILPESKVLTDDEFVESFAIHYKLIIKLNFGGLAIKEPAPTMEEVIIDKPKIVVEPAISNSAPRAKQRTKKYHTSGKSDVRYKSEEPKPTHNAASVSSEHLQRFISPVLRDGSERRLARTMAIYESTSKPKKVEETEMQNFPEGTVIVNGKPYWPAFDQNNQPMFQNGVQLFTDGAGYFQLNQGQQQQQNTSGRQPWQSNAGPVVNNANTWNNTNSGAARNTVVVNSNFANEWDSGSQPKTQIPSGKPTVSVQGGKPSVSHKQSNAPTTDPWEGDDAQPFPIIFNPTTHSLFKVRRDNRVVYDIEKLPKVLTMQDLNSNDQWNYILNELDPRARMRYRSEVLSADTRRGDGKSPYADLRSTLSSSDANDGGFTGSLEGNAIVLSNTPLETVATTWDEIGIEVRNQAAALGCDRGATFISSIHSATEYALPTAEADKLKAMLDVKTMAALALKMRTFVTDATGNMLAYNAIDRHITSYVNEWIRYTVGVQGDISGAAEGCEQLEFDLKKLGSTMVSEAVARTVQPFTDSMLKSIEFRLTDDPAFTTMHFIRRASVVVSPYTFAEFELGVPAGKGYGIINPTTHKQAFEIFKNVLNDEVDPRDDIILLTSDGRIARFICSALVKGSILVVLSNNSIF